MKTNVLAGLALVLVLTLTTAAQGREEIVFFEKEYGEGWAIDPDGRNERKLFDRSADLQQFAIKLQQIGLTRQEAPAGVTLAEERRGTEEAIVLVTDGVRELITPFYEETTTGLLGADGQRVVFTRGGNFFDGFNLFIRHASGEIKYLTVSKRSWGLCWIDTPARSDSALTIERLPAEVSVRGAYGSFFRSDRDREVSEDMASRFRGWNAIGAQVNGVARLPYERMTAHDLERIGEGLKGANGLMANTPFKYSIVPNMFGGACVASAEMRSRDLSARLGPSWTVTSHGVTISTTLKLAHHYSVASFWGEDGTAYHFAMDNYLFDPTITYLGSSGESFPRVWGWLEQERTPENGFYREGERLTHLDGVPVEAMTYDRAALENVRQANARLTAVSWQEVTARPPRATRFGRTYLPFRFTARDPLTQEPLANTRVHLTVAVADGRLGLTQEKGAPGEVGVGTAKLALTTDDAGLTPVAYLRVDDPYLASLTDVALQAQVGTDLAETFTWEVLDNVRELEARFRAAIPAGQGSSVHARILSGEADLQRVPFMSDVLLRSLGDDPSAYLGDRVLGFLSSIAFDPESAHLLNGLLYHPVFVHGRGALHFATVVYPQADSPRSEHARVFDAGAARSPVSDEADAWTARFGGPDQDVALGGLGDGPAEAPRALTVLVSCPVEVLFTDAEGRRVGFADGAYVNELRAPLGHTRQDLPEADGTHAKLVTYADAKGTLTIVGQGDGTFSLDLVYHQADGSALWVEFVDVPIMAGEAVTFPVDAANANLPGERSGGGVIFASGPATRINPPPPPGARRSGGGCSMTGATTPPGLPAAASLVLLALLAWGRRRAAR